MIIDMSIKFIFRSLYTYGDHFLIQNGSHAFDTNICKNGNKGPSSLQVSNTTQNVKMGTNYAEFSN